jgi:hypothetical protein
MRSTLLTVTLLLLSGCAGTPLALINQSRQLDNVRSTNRAHLQKLSLGMTKSQVLDAVGNGSARISMGFLGGNRLIGNPYKTEMFDSGEGALEVLYYYTDLQREDGAISDDELTPVVLRDDKVIGWGRSFFDSTVNKFEIRLR